MEENLIENEYAKIWLEDGVMFCVIKTLKINLSIAKKGLTTRLLATDKKSYLTCIDMRPVRFVSKEARDYLSTAEAAEYIKAGALLVNSPLNKFIGNFFLCVSRPEVHPSKLFTNKAKAICWLHKAEKNPDKYKRHCPNTPAKKRNKGKNFWDAIANLDSRHSPH